MTTIKLKNGSGAPTAGDLAQGEPALDLTNKRLYTEDSGGTVIEVGTNPGASGAVTLNYSGSAKLATTATGIDVTGTVTADGLTVDGDGTLQTSDGAILSIGTTDTSATTGDVIGQVTFANADASPNKANAEIRGMANDAFGRTNIDFRTGNSGTLNTRALISWDGDISFYEDTGTTAKLFWDASAESLGIGTTSPDGGIDIAQAQNTTNQFTSPHLALTATSTTDTTGFTGISYASSSVANYGWTVGALRNTTGNNSDFVFNLHNNSASGSEKMRIDGATGNVGIGTDSPAQALAVESSSAGVTRVNITNTGNAAAGAGVQLITKNGATQVSNATLRTDNAGNFSIFSGTTTEAERMRIDSSGNLLVGGTSYEQAGSIGFKGTGEYSSILSSGAGGEIYAGGAIALVSNGYQISVTTGNAQTYKWHNGTTRSMTLDSSGNLLVGQSSTTTPGTGNTTTGISLRGGDGAIHASRSGNRSLYANRSGTDGPIISIEKDGVEVGSIGTADGELTIGNGDAGLYFWGDSDKILPFNTTTNAVRDAGIDLGRATTRFKDFYLSGEIYNEAAYNQTTGFAANMYVNSAGRFFRSTSSERYKNSIQDATHGLTELLTLRPVTYKGNDDGDLVFGGLIAEEVHDAGLTEFVQYNEESQPDALAYGNMVSLCIKAIQEQNELINDLRARVAQLEGAN